MPSRSACSGERPPGLAEPLALAETKGNRGSYSIQQDTTASDAVTEAEPGSLGRGEFRTVLGLEGVGSAVEFGLVTHLFRRALDHDVKAVIELVSAGGENALLIVAEVLGFAFGGTGDGSLANLCPDTIDEAQAAAHAGLYRIGSDYQLCFNFLDHTGLSL